MNHEFWAKQKVNSMLDKQAVKLSRKLEEAGDDDFCATMDKLERVEKLKEMINKPGVMKSKEFWVEVIKVVGVAAALGAVVWYDAKGHVLPKSLEKWIPGPRL